MNRFEWKYQNSIHFERCIHSTLWSMGHGVYVSHYSFGLVSYQFQIAEIADWITFECSAFFNWKTFIAFCFLHFYLSRFRSFRLSFNFLGEFNSLAFHAFNLKVLLSLPLFAHLNIQRKSKNENHEWKTHFISILSNSFVNCVHLYFSIYFFSRYVLFSQRAPDIHYIYIFPLVLHWTIRVHGIVKGFFHQEISQDSPSI